MLWTYAHIHLVSQHNAVFYIMLLHQFDMGCKMVHINPPYTHISRIIIIIVRGAKETKQQSKME